MTQTGDNAPRRTMLLTGASRGIGHATVKRFSAAGWRVISCSRQPFPENCPWEMGAQDHIQVDLANPQNTLEAIAEIKRRLEDGRLDALVNNAAISPKGEGGSRLGTIDTNFETWSSVFQVNFFAPMSRCTGEPAASMPSKSEPVSLSAFTSSLRCSFTCFSKLATSPMLMTAK